MAELRDTNIASSHVTPVAEDLTAQVDHEDLRALIALADIGTLSGAARQLGVTHATIGRRIAALERTLEASVFERTDGRYVLTAQGEPICRLAREIEDRMLAIRRAAVGLSSEVSGLVRVTSTEGVGAFLVTPLLARLARQLQNVDFMLLAADSNLSLTHREADIALRFGLPEAGHIVGRRCANISYHLYATRAYIDGTPTADYGFIAGPSKQISQPGLDGVLRELRDRRIVFRSNSMTSRWHAARVGLGIALLPRFMGETSGDLVRVDIGAPPTLRELWLLTHRDVKDVPRIRAVADFLYDNISAQRSSLN